MHKEKRPMPARIIGLYTLVMAFFGLQKPKQAKNVDDLIVDSFNRSHKSWVEKGWVKR